MRKQQDMGKVHWLSRPTLVGACPLSTPGTTGPQRRWSSACTSTLHPPQISQLKSPWGRRYTHHTTVGGGGWSWVPIRLRPQKFCGKGGKVVDHPYHLRIPHPKKETRVVGGRQDLHSDTRRGAGPNSTRALRPSMGSRAQKQAKPKITGYPLQHTLPPRQRGFEGFHVGTSEGKSVKHYANRISESVSLIPCHCH